jgi:6-phosphofructokinase 1
MVSIKRISSKPYKWKLITVPLSKVANVEKKLPKNYISSDGFYITSKCRDYLQPLIYGELGPTYKNGIPVYSRLKNIKAK